MEYDLYNQLQEKTRQLETSVKLLRKSGTDLAEAERKYKILLRTECLKLKDEGMAIGLIELTCKGIPSVASARFDRDVADATYKANIESVNSLKLQMRLLENQIAREWGSAGRGDI